jgi:1-deoxy-D-xylulose-5-phosphate synthase
VLFAIDRAGIVGEDGATHAGAFDLSYLQAVPNMLVMAPSDENETCLLLNTGFYAKQPAAVRYPRGQAEGVEITAGFDTVPIGKSKVIKEGANVAILNFGALLHESRIASEAIDATLIDMRFVKPLDQAQLLNVAKSCELIVTVEENALLGGAGSSVALFYQQQGMQVNCLHLGLPDRFIDHGKRPELLSQCGLTGDEMLKRIQACLERSKQSYQRAAFQDK